jgi:hypothetical protein
MRDVEIVNWARRAERLFLIRGHASVEYKAFCVGFLGRVDRRKGVGAVIIVCGWNCRLWI